MTSTLIKLKHLKLHLMVALFLPASTLVAQAPVDYWTQVDTSNPQTLAQTVYETIRDHVRTPYSPSNWPILEAADETPGQPGTILDIYRNEVVPLPEPGDPRPYDREHVWPRSRGFPDGGDWSRHAVADMHNLYLCDRPYNNSRGNNIFANTPPSEGGEERPTVFNNGVGGGTGVYPGNSNWRGETTWEVWIDRRGDAARAVMYMAARYNGGSHADGSLEPDLRLTDNTELLATGAQAVAYMGLLTDILEWHEQDPPDDKEIFRHEVIYDAQQNRNPFIDHPEWGPCIFLGDCEDVAPMRPFGLVATNDGDNVLLEWDPRPETNLLGYHVYRSTTPGSGYTRITSSPSTSTSFVDSTVQSNTAYFYVISAKNVFENESPFSDEVTQTLGDLILISQESFEGTTGYTIEGGTGDFGDSFFGRFHVDSPPDTLVTRINGVDGGYFIAGANTNGVSPPLPSNGIHTIVLDPIDVSGFANLEVRISVNARALNVYDSANLFNGDYLRVLVSIDEDDETMIGQFTKVGTEEASNGRLGVDLNLNGLGDVEIQDYDRLEDYTFTVPPPVGVQGMGDMLVVKIRTRFDANREEIVYDNVRVYGSPLGTTTTSPGDILKIH